MFLTLDLIPVFHELYEDILKDVLRVLKIFCPRRGDAIDKISVFFYRCFTCDLDDVPSFLMYGII